MSEQPDVEITVTAPPVTQPVATVVEAPPHNEIALDFLMQEIQEVETDVKDVRQCLVDGQREDDERLTVIETVLDHLVDRIADLAETVTEHQEPEIIEEPNPPLPEAPKKRKKDTPPRQGNSVRRVFLGRSGGVYP